MDKAGGGFRLPGRWRRTIRTGAVCLLVLLTRGGSAAARDIYSNGRGGGPWSDPATWHGQKVPGPGDVAVIAMRDEVIFDRDDRDQPTCRALYLDPGAVLRFAKDRQQLTLTVAGPIESYGTIQINAAHAPTAVYALRMVGQGEDQRTIHLAINSALLVYGSKTHGQDERNARIAADALDAKAKRQPIQIIADGDAMIDLRDARLDDVQVRLSHLDNTHSVPNERLNIIGNYFAGMSMLRLVGCDTPVVRGNTFHTQDGRAPSYAIYGLTLKLANFQGNTFNGPYGDAITLWHCTSPAISQTQITGVRDHGIEIVRSADASVRDVRIDRVGNYGIRGFSTPNMTLKNVVITDAKLPFKLFRTNAQLTNCSATAPPVKSPDKVSDSDADSSDGDAKKPSIPVLMLLRQASARLINTPMQPDQIRITEADERRGDGPLVETMQYLVVRVAPASAKDGAPADLPAGLRVRVHTAKASGGVPKGRADLNVRNSPVPVSPAGVTPLPLTHHALLLRGWRIDSHGKFRQAPFYKLIVEAPEAGGDGGYAALASKIIEPRADWFRFKPNGPKPTTEVTLP